MSNSFLPDDVLDLLTNAEEAIKDSDDAVLFATVKDQELEEAVDAEEEAREVAFETLEAAVAAASVAITAIKDHFGA